MSELRIDVAFLNALSAKVALAADELRFVGWQFRVPGSHLQSNSVEAALSASTVQQLARAGVAQSTGAVGEGNNPRSSEAFEVGAYYVGPDPVTTRDSSGQEVLDWSVLLDNHNLVATDRGPNRKVLVDIQKGMYE